MIAVTIRYPKLDVIDRFSGVQHMTWDRDLEAEIADELHRCGCHHVSWDQWGSGWCTIVNVTEAKRKEIACNLKIIFQGAVKVS